VISVVTKHSWEMTSEKRQQVDQEHSFHKVNLAGVVVILEKQQW